MPLQRTGNAEFNIQRQGFDFKMLNGGALTRFTVGFSVVRELDGREVMPHQFVDQFNRQRDKIEAVAQQVFSSRQPGINGLIALQRVHFFH